MDLTEKIARLIDPEAWRHWDECAQVWPNPYARPGGAFVADSRAAARRVIDGLHLEEEHVYSFNGDRITHVLGQIHEEDM